MPIPLEQHLSPAQREQLDRLSRMSETRGWRLYLVGGFVRDVLLGLTPDDFDLVVEGDAVALARAACDALGGDIVAHPPFGTATWRSPITGPVDFAAARTETYPQPGALPIVNRPASLPADLARRDFTINAIALDVTGGELIDPFNGQADLERRLIRVLHPASFIDDPTRLFRAARYAGRLGFQIAPESAALIPEAWPALDLVTADRLRHEFELIFREPRADAILSLLHALGVLTHVSPALRWNMQTSRRAERLAELPVADWQLSAVPEPDALYLALLLYGAPDARVSDALARLNVNRAVGEAVRQAVSLSIIGGSPSEVVAGLDSLDELAVIAAWVLHGHDALGHYLATWRFIRSEITGNDLIGRGLSPGPQFREILWQLRAARLDGAVKDVLGEKALLEKLIA